MNKLSLYERPMHCTDAKRETVYIKTGENTVQGLTSNWEKDDENKKLKLALKTVSHIQRKNLTKWVDEHPNWEDNPNLQDEYMLLVRNSTDDLVESNKEDKAIKKV